MARRPRGARDCRRDELPIEALERKALNGYLATNRALQPEMIGSLGMIECQAGPRCRRVVAAMRRLGVPDAALPFYAEHAAADPHHGKDWLDAAVTPLVAEHPDWGPRILTGAWWRVPSTAGSSSYGAPLRPGTASGMTVLTCSFGPLDVEFDEGVLRLRVLDACAERSRRANGSPMFPTARSLEVHCGAGHIGQATVAWSGRHLVQIDDDPTCCEWAARNVIGTVCRCRSSAPT